MVKILEKIIEGVAVCKIEGKLSGFEDKGVVQNKIRDLLSKDVKNVVLDLSKVNWIDSTGLGELIASLSSIKKEDGHMVLANIQGPVRSLLKMTNLNQIFEIFEDVDEALSNLKA